MQPAIMIKPVVVGLAPPPSGVTPNFDHPESIGYRTMIAVSVCLLLSACVLLLRLYTRHFIIHIIGTDDYIIIAAQLLSIGFSVTTITLVKLGIGLHVWDVPITHLTPILKWSIAQGIFFGLSIMCAKLSILQFYLRLSPQAYFRILTHGLSVTVVLYSLVASFQWLYACRPLAKYWDPTISYGSCIDSYIIYVFNAVMNSVTDIFMIFLPILMMWNVQIARRQKFGVIAIFTLGAFVSVVSIIRLVYIVMSRYNLSDSTRDGVKLANWGAIELHVGIICACLPHTKPFLQRHFPKLLRSTVSQSISRANRSAVLDRTTISSHKDISLRVLVTSGETKSIGDTDSQRAILGEDCILVRSDIHIGEESNSQYVEGSSAGHRGQTSEEGKVREVV